MYFIWALDAFPTSLKRVSCILHHHGANGVPIGIVLQFYEWLLWLHNRWEDTHMSVLSKYLCILKQRKWPNDNTRTISTPTKRPLSKVRNGRVFAWKIFTYFRTVFVSFVNVSWFVGFLSVILLSRMRSERGEIEDG